MSYDNNNRGVLFPNGKKEKDSQPDYRGEAVIDGVKKRLAGWKKTSKNGNVFLSLVIEDDTLKESGFSGTRTTPAQFGGDDENLPF